MLGHAVSALLLRIAIQLDLTIGRSMIMIDIVKPINFFSILIVKLCICFVSYAQVNAPEKIHLHIDKPIYLTGETIWYKIYNSNYREHSDHSGVVYINLHDKNGVLLLQQKLKLDDGHIMINTKSNNSSFSNISGFCGYSKSFRKFVFNISIYIERAHRIKYPIIIINFYLICDTCVSNTKS